MTNQLNFILLLLVSFYGFSQNAVFYQTAKTFSFGPRFGFNTSTLFFDNDQATEAQGIRLNFNGGVWGRYQLSDRWSVQTNIDYSPRGSQLIKLNYFDVPVTVAYNVRYKLFKMPMNFDVYAGLQPSFLTGGNFSDLTIPHALKKDQFNNTTVDFVFGSGFPMWRFLFYATNKINISQISGNDFLFPQQNDSTISGKIIRGWSTEWFIGYRFGGSNSYKKL